MGRGEFVAYRSWYRSCLQWHGPGGEFVAYSSWYRSRLQWRGPGRVAQSVDHAPLQFPRGTSVRSVERFRTPVSNCQTGARLAPEQALEGCIKLEPIIVTVISGRII